MLFETPPDNFKPSMTLASCMVKYNDQFLLLLRQPRMLFGNKWAFPGVKLKMATDARDSVAREIMLGTGFIPPKENMRLYKTLAIKFAEHEYIYNLYILELANKPNIHVNEHYYKGYVWATPNEAFKLPMAPHEDECIKMLFNLKPVEEFKGIRNVPWEARRR
jgi:hypothetical protein